jgi:hypothetical protein
MSNTCWYCSDDGAVFLSMMVVIANKVKVSRENNTSQGSEEASTVPVLGGDG